MNQLQFPLISIILWLPALGALFLFAIPRANEAAQRAVALGIALVAFAASIVLPVAFNFTTPGFQFVDSLTWVAVWGLGYLVSVDGISIWLVLLTTLLTPIALMATWNTTFKDLRTYLMLMLLLETSLIGVFVAQDMLLFFIFFEFTLIPTALLIGMWGGEKRQKAATKFFVYNFSGSIFMLLSIIGVYSSHGQQTGNYTFDIATITSNVQTQAFQLTDVMGWLLFGGFFIAFAIKAPLWPFHTWLPEAHTEASSDGSVDVLGLLVKIGAYGFIRFNLPLFPDIALWATPAIAVLAIISILYGAAIAFVQTDMKRLLAYSSVSHVGFIILGIFALNQAGISGAILQIVNQGLVSGGLFLIVGMIYARSQTRDITKVSGLWKAMPIYGSLALALVLASIGVPGLNGFIGEFVIMQGAWLSPDLGWGFVIPTIIGIILAAAYMLRMFRFAFMGDVVHPIGVELQDIGAREIALLVIIFVCALGIGMYPNLLFSHMQGSVEQIVQGIGVMRTAMN